MPGALDTTCGSPCGKMTRSPAARCTGAPPTAAAQQLPDSTKWNSMSERVSWFIAESRLNPDSGDIETVVRHHLQAFLEQQGVYAAPVK
jgi:hypothetical protein